MCNQSETEVSAQEADPTALPPLCQDGVDSLFMAERALPDLDWAGALPSVLASAWACLGAAGNMGTLPEMAVAGAYGPISWGPGGGAA